MKDIAIAVLTPILTALLGVLGLMIGDWRQRRTQAGRRKLALEDASRQVAFATEWWNAAKQLADSAEAERHATTRAQSWLDEAGALVAESTPPPVDERPTITLRRLLIAYPMQSRVARALRGAFYFCLGLVSIFVGFALNFTITTVDAFGLKNYFTVGYFVEVGIRIGTTVFVLMVVAMALRFGAVRVEKSQPTDEKLKRNTLRRALLLYRFNRPAAKIARIVFYVWAVLSIYFAFALSVLLIRNASGVPGAMFVYVGFLGWAVGLRYWVASLEERMGREVSSVAAAATIARESQEPRPIDSTSVEPPPQQQLPPQPPPLQPAL